MATTNHNQALSIYQMVLNRLPFLIDDPTNDALVSAFTFEVMNELEPCFNVKTDKTTGVVDELRIGDEQYYTIAQKSIIADLVAAYILMIQGASGTLGTSGSTPLSTFLSRAAAGSASVEYTQFNIANSAYANMKVDTLLNMYRNNAKNKAYKIGCMIEICDECSINILQNTAIKPFVVINDCGCGC
jgi:hypothetical protein